MKVWLAPVALVSVLALNSCSSSDGAGHKTTGDGQVFNASLCRVLPDVGETALYANAGTVHAVNSNLFNKRYNRAALEGVLSASIIETQNFAIRDGLNVFKIPTPATVATRCQAQYTLGAAPADVRKAWDQASANNTSTAWLDGLFVSFNGGTVMVREDAERWTLVHEMMHANFWRQRRADQIPSEQTLTTRIKFELKTTQDFLDQYKQTADQQALVNAANEAMTLPELQQQALAQGPLEEVAVESLLLQEFLAGRLKYVSTHDLNATAWYIDGNKDGAKKEVTALIGALSKLKTMLDTAGLFDSANNLQKGIDSLAAFSAQIDALSKAAHDAAAAQVQPMLKRASAPPQGMDAHTYAANNTPEIKAFRAGLRSLNASLR